MITRGLPISVSYESCSPSEPDARPCAFLAGLDFNVQDVYGLGYVKYLSTKDADFEKEIFFLPYIRPDEANPRRSRVTYKWPKMMRQLETRGFEIADWTLQSEANIPDAEFRAFFAPNLRRRLKASIVGKRIKGESLVEGACDLPGYGDWDGWVYTLRDAPAATYQIKFKCRSSEAPPRSSCHPNLSGWVNFALIIGNSLSARRSWCQRLQLWPASARPVMELPHRLYCWYGAAQKLCHPA